MPVSGLVLFALTYFVAVATPGPGIAAVLARALGKGLKGMPAFIAGFVLGDLTLYAAAAAGFAALPISYGCLLSSGPLLLSHQLKHGRNKDRIRRSPCF